MRNGGGVVGDVIQAEHAAAGEVIGEGVDGEGVHEHTVEVDVAPAALRDRYWLLCLMVSLFDTTGTMCNDNMRKRALG